MAVITNVADLVESLKREVAVPGEFDTTFPNTDDDSLFACLCDGFSEARLDGFFGDNSLDWVSGDLTSQITDGEGSLLVIYSAIRILRASIRSQAVSNTYKAGNVEYSTSQSANVLQAEMAALIDRRKELLQYGDKAIRTHVNDSYYTRGGNCWGSGFFGDNNGIYGNRFSPINPGEWM